MYKAIVNRSAQGRALHPPLSALRGAILDERDRTECQSLLSSGPQLLVRTVDPLCVEQT